MRREDTRQPLAVIGSLPDVEDALELEHLAYLLNPPSDGGVERFLELVVTDDDPIRTGADDRVGEVLIWYVVSSADEEQAGSC